MRFFHRKHHCYIVGEGSFTGQHSILPSPTEDSASSSPTSEDSISKKSPVHDSPSSKMEVTVDVEPREEADRTLSLIKSFSENSEEYTPSLKVSLEASLQQSFDHGHETTKSCLQADDDNVIDKDGKLE